MDTKTVLAELYQQMREYTQMTELLPFADFQAYYQKLMSFLQDSYQDLDQDGLIKMLGICSIVGSNAQSRGAEKTANRKKFNKMGEKSSFWHGAIKARLLKEGLTEEELEQRNEELWKD